MTSQARVKGIVLGFTLIIFTVAPILPSGAMHWHYSKAVAADSAMPQVKLILKKLRSSMDSMKDFDDLEAVGMSKKDVDRMRRAMNQKIHQLTDEAIKSIQNI